MCPHCRQNAPLVYRGVSAFCTACGAPRMPLASPSVTMAGQTSKAGGIAVRVLGWILLAAGWVSALGLVGLLSLFNATWWAMLAVAGPIAFVASLVAYFLLRGGKQLKQSGDETEEATKNQAIFALANTRGGVLRAIDVARSLQVTEKEGDFILTKLAKEHPDHVAVDIGDDGTVLYRFPAVHWGSERVAAMAPNAPFVPRGAPPHVRVGAPSAVRVDPRSPLEEDADLALEPPAAQLKR